MRIGVRQFLTGVGCAMVVGVSGLHAQTPQSITGNVYDALFGPGNQIYVSASFLATNGQTYQGNLRLNSNGSIDTSFAVSLDNPAVSFGVTSDGSVLANGTAFVTKYSSTGAAMGAFGQIFDSRALVMGSGGTSFYTGGGIYTTSGAQSVSFGVNALDAYASAVESDGKILLGGTNGSLLRLNANGTLDTSFTAPGALAGGTVHGISVQSDGKVIVSGSGFQSGSNVVRLNANGAIDGTFSASTSIYGPAFSLDDGTTLISSGANGTQISFDSTGRIVTAGSLIRLDSSGSLYSVQPSVVSGFESLSAVGLGVYSLTAIPEPGTYAVIAGLASLAFAGWRRWTRGEPGGEWDNRRRFISQQRS